MVSGTECAGQESDSIVVKSSYKEKPKYKYKFGSSWGFANLSKSWYTGEFDNFIKTYNAYSMSASFFFRSIILEGSFSIGKKKIEEINFNGDFLEGPFYASMSNTECSIGYQIYSNWAFAFSPSVGYLHSDLNITSSKAKDYPIVINSIELYGIKFGINFELNFFRVFTNVDEDGLVVKCSYHYCRNSNKIDEVHGIVDIHQFKIGLLYSTGFISTYRY